MTTDAPPPTRRALRAEGRADTGAPDDAATPAADPVRAVDAALAAAPVAPADADLPGTLVLQQAAEAPIAYAAPIALTWVDETRISLPAPAPAASGGDLLTGRTRRSPWRPGVLVPTGLILALAGVYAATMLLWPLHAVAPTIEPVAVQTVPAPAAAPAWPAQGGAAISVAGIDGALSNGAGASSIASITKVVTALLVLDAQPLALGESGPEYRFTAADRTRYWQYRSAGESALDVPVGGTLTQYQLLEGMLIGSANNYADRLAQNLWPSDAVFAQAARSWLATHGIPGVTIVDPSGIEPGNAASPEALLALAARAMANPVIAEIVGKQSVELPGVGSVTNTNPLMIDPGMVGIKTGTLDAYNLLSAKDVPLGDTTVRLYAAVLGQPDTTTRDDATRALFTQLENELALRPSVTAGTVAGQVVTRWGEVVDVVTAADAAVILWNGGASTATAEFARGDRTASGDVVGTLSVAGPLDSRAVDLELAADIEGPTAWWRLTHPLDLLGLNGR